MSRLPATDTSFWLPGQAVVLTSFGLFGLAISRIEKPS
jgi:hypothetical protein